MNEGPEPYPPIADYALLGDCHGAALVSSAGSIDWCCLPRFDSGPIFGRLLDWPRGGHLALTPVDEGWSTSRRYVGDTLVLETTVRTRTGEAVVTDCLARPGPTREPHSELLRVVEGRAGHVELELVVAPRFDHGLLVPWLSRHGDDGFAAVGGDDAVLVRSDVELELDEHEDRLRALVRTIPGSRQHLSVRWLAPERLDEPDDRSTGELGPRVEDDLERTRTWWTQWADRGDGRHGTGTAVRRSALTLKGLTYETTGAIVAAPTTSLPEAPGGSRNWDYRLSWVRDSQFTVRSLGELGHPEEADAYRRFVQRSAAGSASVLQVMYGVTGRRRLPERTLPLEGYRGATPVRIGNDAAGQNQHDLYGYVLDLAWHWHLRGSSPGEDDWRFLTGLAEEAARRWSEPDAGIWEVRHDPQHFVHSKVMCWSTLERAIRLAEECDLPAPLDGWRACCDEIRRVVEDDGYDTERGTFRRAFGSDEVDAALLLLPHFDFVAFDDPRMLGTVDAVRSDLEDDGLLRRYRADDGLSGDEGAFIACTFWLAECLAGQGRLDEASAAFERAATTANDVGLFSEEVEPGRGELLGNFPQGLTHLSHVAAAVALDRARRHHGRP